MPFCKPPNEKFHPGNRIAKLSNLQNSVTLNAQLHKTHTQFNISTGLVQPLAGAQNPLRSMLNPSSHPKPVSDAPKSADESKTFITGMIVAASALVGAFAVVLWNRRALSRLHTESAKKPLIQPDDEP
jgi:hypothetical protein